MTPSAATSAAAGMTASAPAAYTTKWHKLGLLGLSILRAGAVTVLPENPVIYAPPLPEVAFLVEAAAHPERSRTGWGDKRSVGAHAARES